jgi:hypothetical protein
MSIMSIPKKHDWPIGPSLSQTAKHLAEAVQRRYQDWTNRTRQRQQPAADTGDYSSVYAEFRGM